MKHCQLCYMVNPGYRLWSFNEDGSVTPLQVCRECHAAILTQRRRLGAELEALPPGPQLDAFVEQVLRGAVQ